MGLTGTRYVWYRVPVGVSAKEAATALLNKFYLPDDDGKKRYILSYVEWGDRVEDGTRHPCPTRPDMVGRKRKYKIKGLSQSEFDTQGIVLPPVPKDEEERDIPKYEQHSIRALDADNFVVVFVYGDSTPWYVLETTFYVNGVVKERPGTNGVFEHALDSSVTHDGITTRTDVLAEDTPFRLHCELFIRHGFSYNKEDWVPVREYDVEGRTPHGQDNTGDGEPTDNETDEERQERERRERIRRNGNRDILLLTGGLIIVLVAGALAVNAAVNAVAGAVVGNAAGNVGALNAGIKGAQHAAEAEYDAEVAEAVTRLEGERLKQLAVENAAREVAEAELNATRITAEQYAEAELRWEAARISANQRAAQEGAKLLLRGR